MITNRYYKKTFTGKVLYRKINAFDFQLYKTLQILTESTVYIFKKFGHLTLLHNLPEALINNSRNQSTQSEDFKLGVNALAIDLLNLV